METKKPGFSLAETFGMLQNAQKATISLVQMTKNLVSLRVSGSEIRLIPGLGIGQKTRQKARELMKSIQTSLTP